MPQSSATKQAEEVLEQVLRTIREDYENPNYVLCEMDRNRFVKEEESLREQLRQTVESESNASWRNLLCLPSPRAVKCLKDSQELHRRVREDINAKLRTRLTGKSNPPSSHGQISTTSNLIGARTPVPDLLLAGENSKRASTIVTSPLNMNCSPSEPQLETMSDSSVGTRNSSIRRHRRSPPPPPLRRIAPSGNSSETSSISGSDSPRRSHSVRRPAPPPPLSPRQSSSPRSPRSPTIVSFPSPGLPPNPALVSSMSRFAQQMNTLASSMVTESRKAQGTQGLRSSGYVSKTNCVDISGSNVDGLTLNNGGTNNSGAVIHKTMVPPPRVSQPIPQF